MDCCGKAGAVALAYEASEMPDGVGIGREAMSSRPDIDRDWLKAGESFRLLGSGQPANAACSSGSQMSAMRTKRTLENHAFE